VRPAKRWLLLPYLALLLALFVFTGVESQGLRKYERLQKEAERFAAVNDSLRAQNARLGREVRALAGDPAALERAAREELGYVRPGEIVIQLDERKARP